MKETYKCINEGNCQQMINQIIHFIISFLFHYNMCRSDHSKNVIVVVAWLRRRRLGGHVDVVCRIAHGWTARYYSMYSGRPSNNVRRCKQRPVAHRFGPFSCIFFSVSESLLSTSKLIIASETVEGQAEWCAARSDQVWSSMQHVERYFFRQSCISSCSSSLPITSVNFAIQGIFC